MVEIFLTEMALATDFDESIRLNESQFIKSTRNSKLIMQIRTLTKTRFQPITN